MKKTLFNSFKIGIKKGWSLPTLPKHLLELNQKPHVRIFRFLGGVSALAIITNRIQILGDGYLFLTTYIFCTILTLTLAVYHIYLSYHRTKHIYKLIKSGATDVYN